VSNLTVWEDLPSLETFVYQTLHSKFMDRKVEWFEMMTDQHFAMWQIEEGHRPTLEEGLAKIALRQDKGDTPEAFGWDWARANL